MHVFARDEPEINGFVEWSPATNDSHKCSQCTDVRTLQICASHLKFFLLWIITP